MVLLGLAGAQDLFHTVQRGETLFSIARRYGTTVETLMHLNGLSRPNLEVGQVLRLPGSGANPSAPSTPSQPAPAQPSSLNPAPQPGNPSSAQPQPSPTPAATGSATYSVQRGDTLFSIARRLGVTVEALKGENNLTGTALSVGQVLKVPAASPTPPP
ncbi:MAG TPA: LysM peptidoglycan-binding domain-containing protein, partial [Meiothermus sp.]|nr:LysM peptidoglycan-binding domain-containing protein [Meiothermus sp.]